MYKFFFILLLFLSFISFSPRRVHAAEPPKAENIADSLFISNLRNKEYSGSDLKIEQKLLPKKGYNQYIASYQSEGLKVYGLLTIPTGKKPKNGWPAIIFNHGYIQPEIYTTTGRYIAYVDAFARSGYIVFKPDYRGHGKSEGLPEGQYYSPAYTTDVLNALASIKRHKDVNKEKIGMWGHSMGGHITLRSIVINQADIKAAVIWGGVVAPYSDIMYNWVKKTPFHPSPKDVTLVYEYRKKLTETYGSPTSSPDFWNAIDPFYFAVDVKTPVQLHTGTNDLDVPYTFSKTLYDKLIAEGKKAELHNYKGGNHNISGPHFNTAMQRSISFFNKYLK